MARHSATKGPVLNKKSKKFSIDIRYLVVANLVLNIVILYFLKFS